MKFLADMGISPKTVDFLRQQGYNAVHLHEQGLERLSDTAILQKARHEARIVLTHDLDFGELMAAGGETLPSVIIFRLRKMQPPTVNRYLHQILQHYQDILRAGVIVSVVDGQIRWRKLPIEIDRE